jgi:hypothetical protein
MEGRTLVLVQLETIVIPIAITPSFVATTKHLGVDV